MTELIRRKRRLVVETPFRVRGRPVIVNVQASGLRFREKGRRGFVEITSAQVYNRSAGIAAELGDRRKNNTGRIAEDEGRDGCRNSTHNSS
jgi:hypothetical protein